MRREKANNAREAIKTVHEVTVTPDSDELEEKVEAADIVNDYLMKQLYNDPRNHVKPEDQISLILG